MHARDAASLASALATEQHGVVSHAQLVAAGADRDRIKREVRSGRLIALHRGVYAVGHLALTWHLAADGRPARLR